jgi:hypothetical protein
MQVSGYNAAMVSTTQQPTPLQKTQGTQNLTAPRDPSQDPQQAQSTPPASPRNGPTVNAQGQTTGRILNVQA